MKETIELKPYWCSFYHTENLGPFTMYNPWWRSGWRDDDDAATVVCAIMAENENDALKKICASFDIPPAIGDVEWRFVERIERGSVFSDRFPRRDWMIWDE